MMAMKSLKELLKQHKETWGAKAKERDARREEWIQAVHRFMDQIREWLKDLDPNGDLQVGTQEHELREEWMGFYKVPGLSIRLGSNEVKIIPRGRNTLAKLDETGGRAEGMVEISDGGYGYYVFRQWTNHGDLWVWTDRDDYFLRPLDKSSLETLLVNLLA